MMDDSCNTQLVEWLRGNPQHNVRRDECCPDFSCCSPHLLWPIELRRKFVEASDKDRDSALSEAVGAMIAAPTEPEPTEEKP